MKYSSCVNLIESKEDCYISYPKLKQLNQGTYFKFVHERSNTLFSELMVVVPFNKDTYDYSFYHARKPSYNWVMVKSKGEFQNARVQVYDVEIVATRSIDNSKF